MSRRTKVILRDVAPSTAVPTFTGTGFLASVPLKGSFDGKPCKSLDEVATRYGLRQTWSVFYDWCELFFREGGKELYISPVRGPAALKAFANITATGTTLIVRAISEGEWANGAAGGVSFDIVNGAVGGGSTRQIVLKLNGITFDTSPEFDATAATRDALVAWSQNIDHVRIELGGGSGIPATSTGTNLASGTLDRASITQTQVTAALARFTRDLGPGQEACPDWQTPAAHGPLLASAMDHNRFAACDSTGVESKATTLTLVNAIQGNVNGYRGALVHPWVTITGTATETGRTVPASAFFAAKCNQVDLAVGPNQAPAGAQYGRQTSSLVTGVTGSYSDADANELEAAGVTLVINRRGQVQIDGNVTLAEPGGVDDEWLQTGNVRFLMAIIAEFEAEGESLEHIQVTPINIAKANLAATGVMMRHEDSLFPTEDDPGWIVDTGDSVNTEETIGDGELIVAIGFRPAPGANLVIFYLTRVGVGDPVG